MMMKMNRMSQRTKILCKRRVLKALSKSRGTGVQVVVCTQRSSRWCSNQF